MERLQKYLSECGIASRRKSEELILKGKVIVKDLGFKVSDKDIVLVDNVKVERQEKIYFLLYKPEKTICSVHDEKGRRTVIDLINTKEKIFPVGRLDYDTSGLLLLTNDGELSNKLTHPSGSVTKTYYAKVEGIVTDLDYNPIVSESKIYDFLKNIADSHDTSWMMDEYRKGVSSTIIVNSSSKGDGSIFDIKSEFEYLRDQMMAGTLGIPQEKSLALSENAVVYDANEKLGKTYIEVDMGKQMLYYYVDGELNMDMPVVTGNVNRSRGTPTGIYPVYNKRYHTYLRGVDYVSYVNYLLGVNKGVGIHDANWRSKFGDEIYKSDGSHGCINCPYDSVEVLWDVVDIGTPVILYY